MEPCETRCSCGTELIYSIDSLEWFCQDCARAEAEAKIDAEWDALYAEMAAEAAVIIL